MILKNIGLLVTSAAHGGQSELHSISNAAIIWDEAGIIQWVGASEDTPARFQDEETLDARGCLVIPGLIDCHTHLAFGGWRADEFEQRLRGKSYRQIADEGGGILSTVRSTREATHETLVTRCLNTLHEMKKLGVTTVECKSGYGLSYDSEMKLLEVYQTLSRNQPLSLVPTFLGAHTIPPEFKSSRGEYLTLLTERLIPDVASRKLARFCDVFVEQGAFTLEEGRQVLEAGKRHGLLPKLHADQMSDGNGTALAAEVGAVSADHLEYASQRSLEALRDAGGIAVALPFATLYTKDNPLDARKLIELGVPLAVATDFNPGTAPSYHLPFALTLACTLYGFTPSEALKGATSIAARALKLEDEVGSLEIGKRADLALIDASDVNHWLYHLRPNACVATLKDGKVIYHNSFL